MNRVSGISLLIAICFQYGCRSFIYSKGGRVESKYRNYYFNDSLNVGAVVYGDMELFFGDSINGDSLPKFTHFCKAVLKKFKIGSSDTILFSSIPKTYSIIGLVRNSTAINQNEYKNVLDRRIFYLMKTIKYKNREAYEGLIRIDQNRFLSIIDYGESDREHAEAGFHTIMIKTAQRIRDGESMESVVDAFEDAEDLFNNDGYLTPFKLAENRNNYKEKSLVDQALATYYSFCGDIELVRRSERSFMDIKQENIEAKNLSPAAIAILNQTSDKQVVMFNTAHHRPEHAYFVGQLLELLHQQGYTHLALEALGDSAMVMENGFVNYDDGFYTRDPVMSNLISKAFSIGFKIINYDTDSEDREEVQAKNIVDQIFKTNKDCKLIVLAGYAHIDETATPKKMAAFFRDKTNIDPFTIDQTTLMTSSCKNLEAGNKEEVFIYTNNDLKTGTDLVVWNNINMQTKPVGFPIAGAVRDITINIPDLSAEKDSLAAFIIYNHVNFLMDSTVTPVFVKVIPVKKNAYQLKLEKGRYLVKCLGKNKRLLYKRELIVN
jgi:hypothetical protein